MKPIHCMAVDLQITLKHNDKKYVVIDEWIIWTETDQGNYFNALYIKDRYEDSNSGCDCNKAMLINRFYPDFPEEMPCGDKIKIVGIRIDKNSLREKWI